MRIETTPVAGVALVHIEPHTDDRGFFARSFDRAAFAEAGLDTELVQANISFNRRAGTLRGMHYQLPVAPEAKLVRCTRGALLDQIVDVRPDSPTYLQHVSVELTADNHVALYVPPMFAHGFITLVDDTEATYNVSAPYTPGVERGLRHDDPDLGLSWPVPVSVISDKDASWPLLAENGGKAPSVIITDSALAKRQREGRPIRVGMVGAGFQGRGLANQIINSTPGMELVAIANRTEAKGVRAYEEAGATATVVDSRSALERAIRERRPAVVADALELVAADGVDCVVDVTGAVEHGARVTMAALEAGTPVVTMNAELDATVGPEVARRFAAAGVMFTGADGDQPGVTVNLLRFVRGIGLTPLVAGNIKGLQDPYRTPTTQQGFAEKWGQDPWMVTSFADGTKISFEQAIVANAWGMSVPQRGMNGWDHRGHVDELTTRYDVDELKAKGGVVDYVVGSKPGPGVYVLATHDDPRQQHYLNLYKLGEGPLYSFYTPYHLCHFEVPTTVVRAVDFDDAALVAAGDLKVEVLTTAKTDLAAGTTIDGLGGYHVYGQAEDATTAREQRLLPLGLAPGCTLRVDVPKDAVITYDMVEVPSGRLVDELRAAQDARLAPLG